MKLNRLQFKIECCNNIKEAINDEVIKYDKGLGNCIINIRGKIPISFCPWCGKQLVTSPSMLYRP